MWVGGYTSANYTKYFVFYASCLSFSQSVVLEKKNCVLRSHVFAGGAQLV